MTENETTQNTHLGKTTVAVAPGGFPVQVDNLSAADNTAHLMGSHQRYNQHLFLGSANWYRDNVDEMPVDVLQRHRSDLDGKMALHEKGYFDLLEADRMEIVEALKVIEERLDEVLPKVPAAIDEHDRNVGNRVHNNWPEYLQRSTLQVHLHLCELIDSWRMHPERRSDGFAGANEVAETEGISAFDFDVVTDRSDFIDHYELDDFVVTQTQYETHNGEQSYYLVLSNKFTPTEVNGFLDVYKRAINSLAIIADQRRRAMNVDGGKVGFITAEHFSSREAIELKRIEQARSVLGAGPKVRQ